MLPGPHTPEDDSPQDDRSKGRRAVVHVRGRHGKPGGEGEPDSRPERVYQREDVEHGAGPPPVPLSEGEPVGPAGVQDAAEHDGVAHVHS